MKDTATAERIASGALPGNAPADLTLARAMGGRLPIKEKHRTVLEIDKKISPEIVAERGYYSADDGYRFPIFPPAGDPDTGPIVVVRLDEPGKLPKYLWPKGVPVRLDVLPRFLALADRIDIPIDIVEGIPKSDALTSALAAAGVDRLVVGLNGVWCFGAKPMPGLPIKSDWHVFDLNGREVRIVFDSDAWRNPKVESALRALTEFLRSLGARVRWVRLPDEPTGGKMGVDDWLAAGGTVAELEALTSDAAETVLPRIDTADADLPRTSAATLDALVAANDPPTLFVHGGGLTRVERDKETERASARTLDEDRLSYEAARAANWVKSTRVGDRPAMPPSRVLRDVLATPAARLPFPSLEAIVGAPVFAPDGTLDTSPGYHPQAKTLYAPEPGFVARPVPEVPTAADLAEAKRFIFDELLCDFPFTGDAERANAAALFVDPFVRPMVDGATPLRMIEGPTPGSGKGMLGDALLMPALGRSVAAMTAAQDDGEWQKRLLAALLKAPAAVHIDNVNGPLDSAALASVLTVTDTWTGRRLGGSEMVDVPVRALFVATANNPTMSTEIARRTVRIRLDPKTDRPWQRTGFRHDDLRGWVLANRAALVWAGHVLVRHWLAEGRPKAPNPVRLGSYEAWSDILGGILGAAGIDGFLGNLDDFYEEADTEGALWREFVDVWFLNHGTEEVSAADLFLLTENVEGFDFGAKGGDRAQRTAFGMALAKQRDRVIGQRRIVLARTVNRLKRWRLVPTSSTPPDGTESNVPLYLNVPSQPHVGINADGKSPNAYGTEGQKVHGGTQGTYPRRSPNGRSGFESMVGTELPHG